MTKIRERPILFSAPMVRAIPRGAKFQTRRAIKPQPPEDFAHAGGGYVGEARYWSLFIEPNEPSMGWENARDFTARCKYGKPGDRLYVKETWAPFDSNQNDPPEFVWYRADNSARNIDGELLDTYAMPDPKWKSPIFMPRALSRILLEITDIRVERVQDITTADALAEGVNPFGETDFPDPVGAFFELWNSINGKSGYDVNANPFAWCISFKRIENGYGQKCDDRR